MWEKSEQAYSWLLTGGVLGFGALIDFIVILCGYFKDKEGAYLKRW
ncbi:MAG: hypothetical protein ACOYIA_00710 [Eubacteriales bacterium]|jgi:hypothetical protein